MTKRPFVRRGAWVGVALTVVVLAFGVTTRLLSLIPGITEDNVRRIHIGMTAREVAAILGEPTCDGDLSEGFPRSPGTMPGMFPRMGFPGRGPQPIPRAQWGQWIEAGRAGVWRWWDTQFLITIEFDDNSQVCAVERLAATRPVPTEASRAEPKTLP